ncbi:hypothetical protein OH76DRAFT_1307036, partial [Lentinus brumalis]
MEPYVVAALVMTTVLHSVAAVSRMYGQYILATLEAVLFGAFVWCNTQGGGRPELTPAQARVLETLPADVRTAMSWLGLEPDIVRHACC